MQYLTKYTNHDKIKRPIKYYPLSLSRDLVEIAKHNAENAGIEVEFRQGNVSELPFAADRFNFVVCVFAFKNFKEPIRALREMYRVLKPGGTVLIMDLNGKASLASTKKVAEGMGLRGFTAYIAGAIQRGISYNRKEFETFISQSEFKKHEIKDTDMGFSIYLRK